MRRFLDTNVLLYSISTAPAEAAKREVAVRALSETGNVLSVQVLQEFYVQATRVTRPDALPHALAVGLMKSWARFPVQESTSEQLWEALALKERYGWSFWDAAVVASAQLGDCTELWTEDLQHGQVIGGLTIVNPFGLGR